MGQPTYQSGYGGYRPNRPAATTWQEQQQYDAQDQWAAQGAGVYGDQSSAAAAKAAAASGATSAYDAYTGMQDTNVSGWSPSNTRGATANNVAQWLSSLDQMRPSNTNFQASAPGDFSSAYGSMTAYGNGSNAPRAPSAINQKGFTSAVGGVQYQPTNNQSTQVAAQTPWQSAYGGVSNAVQAPGAVSSAYSGLRAAQGPAAVTSTLSPGNASGALTDFSSADVSGFDPSAAGKEFASGAVGQFNQNLTSRLGTLQNQAVGAGRLRTGFYDRDQGSVATQLGKDFNNQIAQEAGVFSGQKLGALESGAGMRLSRAQGIDANRLTAGTEADRVAMANADRGLAGMTAQNQFALSQAGGLDSMSQANADRTLRAGEDTNQFALSRAGGMDSSGLASRSEADRLAMANADRAQRGYEDVNQFGLSQAESMDSSGLAARGQDIGMQEANAANQLAYGGQELQYGAQQNQFNLARASGLDSSNLSARGQNIGLSESNAALGLRGAEDQNQYGLDQSRMGLQGAEYADTAAANRAQYLDQSGYDQARYLDTAASGRAQTGMEAALAREGRYMSDYNTQADRASSYTSASADRADATRSAQDTRDEIALLRKQRGDTGGGYSGGQGYAKPSYDIYGQRYA